MDNQIILEWIIHILYDVTNQICDVKYWSALFAIF